MTAPVISTRFDGENILSVIGNKSLTPIKVPTILLKVEIEGQGTQVLEYRPIEEFQNAVFGMLLEALCPSKGFKKYKVAEV